MDFYVNCIVSFACGDNLPLQYGPFTDEQTARQCVRDLMLHAEVRDCHIADTFEPDRCFVQNALLQARNP